MASLREEARWILDTARDGILWFAVWKTGRSWHIREIYSAEYCPHNWKSPEKWEIDADDLQTLEEIYAEDENANLLNGYYRNIGSLEEMTLESLMDGIRFQYDHGGNLEDILDMMKEDAK